MMTINLIGGIIIGAGMIAGSLSDPSAYIVALLGGATVILLNIYYGDD